MNERKLEHVRWLGQAVAARKQLWTAHRKQLFGAQTHDVEARPIAIAMPHGEIDVLAREVYVMQRRRHAQIDARVRPRQNGPVG